jgi:hypothetical protein
MRAGISESVASHEALVEWVTCIGVSLRTSFDFSSDFGRLKNFTPEAGRLGRVKRLANWRGRSGAANGRVGVKPRGHPERSTNPLEGRLMVPILAKSARMGQPHSW